MAAAELGEAARAFAANFGTWSVNEADKTAANPNTGARPHPARFGQDRSSV
jgi:hypothetical protein